MDRALQYLIEQEQIITVKAVKAMLHDAPPVILNGKVSSVDLGSYDCLLQEQEAAG